MAGRYDMIVRLVREVNHSLDCLLSQEAKQPESWIGVPVYANFQGWLLRWHAHA